MRLFIDCRYVRTQVHDGISRYTASLVQAAAARAEITMLISDPAQLNLLPEAPWVLISSPTGPKEPFVALQINRHHPDVVFSPMQTMGSLGRRYPLILTLHDLIYYQHPTPPKNLPAPIRLGWRLFHLSYLPQRLMLNRADAVATVSQTTAGLIAEHRLTSRDVHVIPNAAQQVDHPRSPEQPPTKDLVYMGSFMEYKNVQTLIRAVNRLPDYRLHLCSPVEPARRAQLSALAQRPGQLVWHRGISEADYIRLLRRATALLTLSRAEGYGLPVIEAMSHGTPVVVSDLPIFQEVIGTSSAAGAAQVVTPDDDAAAASAVRRLQDPVTFRRASEAAARRSRAYDWEDSAQRLLSLAESLRR
ncbi:glycosyltransferase family 4 protein [Garicola koreensis]|uniref:Glycosyltransferase involved in cell wall biosynthesis n=1 Tax=Garicola koreensis TaxID=1262554 RepID=A0A7W5XP43_9MICC|nr:glycosyltransferase family 1 protein [Garicola koreensis]MBB3667492.1 glycosyltransferase involved in cell wall biosynthesis [Garicola koreensis]